MEIHSRFLIFILTFNIFISWTFISLLAIVFLFFPSFTTVSAAYFSLSTFLSSLKTGQRLCIIDCKNLAIASNLKSLSDSKHTSHKHFIMFLKWENWSLAGRSGLWRMPVHDKFVNSLPEMKSSIMFKPRVRPGTFVFFLYFLKTIVFKSLPSLSKPFSCSKFSYVVHGKMVESACSFVQ